MGLTRLSSIPVWNPAQQRDPDAAEPIGSISARDPITLTKVFITDSKTVEFGPEQDGFLLWRGRPLEVRTKDTPVTQALRLTTVEISTRNRDHIGNTAVIGYRPSSVDWFGWSSLKSVSKRPNLAIQKLLEATAASPFAGEAALWAMLSDMLTDPFGNEKSLYARFRQLERTDTLGNSDQYYSDEDRVSVTGTKANRRAKDPELTFGICQDFNACRDLLSSSDHLTDALGYAKHGVGKKHNGTELPLATTAQSLAGEIMAAAIVKALSGVGPEERARLSRDKKCTEVGSVAVLARWIFEDDLRNLHRRNDDGTRIYEVEMPETVGTHFSSRSESAAQISREEIQFLIKTMREQTKERSRSLTPDLWNVVLRLLNLESEPSARDHQIQNGCIYAAVLAHYLPMPDHVIERLKKLRQEYPLFVEAALGLEII